MKKSLLASVTLAALLAPTAVFAEGFGVIEHHAEGVAMGGAAMFIENDAGNMAYNPAGITLCEGKQIKVSATYISPHGDWSAVSKPITNGATIVSPGFKESGKNRVHPAWAPGTYYVRKIDDKQWVGLGCFCRFGNLSEFEAGTLAATNNRFAKMQGLSITPTYARKAGRKFYWAAGADINYVKLEMQKDFSNGMGVSELAMLGGDHGSNQTEGISWALGWNVGLRYAPTDKDEIGFAYRSKIAHTMDADFDWWGINIPGAPSQVHTKAHGKVTLPDSFHLGYSHKFDSKNRVEIGAIRTQWHNFKNLEMTFDSAFPETSNTVHNWKDTWRYAIGYEHKFSKKYTGMLGFAFDDSGIPTVGGGYMVPIGCRRTYSAGIKYTDKWHTLALTLGWQVEGDQNFVDHTKTDGYKSARMTDSIAKIFSIGYTYHF